MGKISTRELLQKAQLSKVSPNVIKAVAALAIVIVCVAVFRWMPSAMGSEFAMNQDSEQVVANSENETSAESQAGASVIVHVVGAVNVPGIYTLQEGNRVSDAVSAAGGFTSDACEQSINCARVVTDGEQIKIPTWDEVSATSSAAVTDGTSSSASGSGLVNINTATLEELQTLSGVGPATATAIIDYRTQNGSFKTIEDIQNVSGIGEAKFSKIQAHICV